MKRRTMASTVALAMTASAATLIATPALAVAGSPYDTYDGTAAASSSPSDAVVGVGSDTTQIVVHDLAEAYNANHATGKLSSFSADGSPTSIFLRTTSSAAITRPNGSGPGKATLFSPSNSEVDFARSSSTLSTDEANANLQQAAFAIDGLKMAVASTSNAPASLTPAQIVGIYTGTFTKWTDVGGTSTETIHPLIPQSGSGTGKFFAAKLKEANGGTTVTINNAVVSPAQEHDPSLIQGNPNAIAPFSTARAKSISSIKLLSGTSWKRAVYNVVRVGDKTRLDSIFGPTGFVCSTAGRDVVEADGFDPIATTAQGGKCGVFTTEEITGSDLVSFDEAGNSATTLVGSAANGGNVKLTATVDALSTDGSVAFTENGAEVGTSTVDASGHAVTTLTSVSVGEHHYKAVFSPADTQLIAPSTSSEITVTVKKTSAVTLTLTPATQYYARTVTAKANVTSDGAPATGSVSFAINGATVKTAPLAGGTVTVTLPYTTPVGTKPVKATYLGAADTFGSSAQASLTIVRSASTIVGKLYATTVHSTANAKVLNVVKIYKGAASVYPTGYVVVKLGSSQLAKVKVVKGQAIALLPKLKPGKYKLTSTYLGSSYVKGSVSAPYYLTVVR